MTEPTKDLEHYRLGEMMDSRVDVAIDKHKRESKEELETMFTIKLSKYENAFSIGKFVVVTVAILAIGTLYQIFISLANSGTLK